MPYAKYSRFCCTLFSCFFFLSLFKLKICPNINRPCKCFALQLILDSNMRTTLCFGFIFFPFRCIINRSFSAWLLENIFIRVKAKAIYCLLRLILILSGDWAKITSVHKTVKCNMFIATGAWDTHKPLQFPKLLTSVHWNFLEHIFFM